MKIMRLVVPILWKMSVLLVVPLAACYLLLSLFGFSLLDLDYARVFYDRDFANSYHDYARVLIMGDSTAQRGWDPTLLTDDTYDYALGASTPVDSYFRLKDYLDSNPAPEYLIYSVHASEFYGAGSFMNRMMYFHRIDAGDISEVVKVCLQHGVFDAWFNSGGGLL